MTKINYKSDFDFIAEVEATGEEGNKVAIGFPQYDWEIILTTGDCNYNSRPYIVSYHKGVATNCYNDNGMIHIICDNHKLSVGQLQMEFCSFLPNSNYPDGTQKVVATYDLDIELTTENTGITSAEVQIVLPFLYDSAYNQAVKGGYKGTQEEYYQLASQLPNAVETAIKVQSSADSLADSAEQIGGAIETLGVTTDAIEQGASTIATSASKVETSATTLEGVSTIISDSATSLSDSATAIAEGANTIKGSAEALQENADKVSESATKVEQAVEPLVQASESLDATKQAFEMLSSEWSDGRQAIATALTNRRYPTEPSESFHAMADKITNMSYEEGWFAKIGYTDENDGGIKDEIDYSYELAKGWNPDGSTPQLFRGTKITFAPILDWSNVKSSSGAFRDCSGLVTIPFMDLRNCTTTTEMCYNCNALRQARICNSNNVNYFGYMFEECKNLEKVDCLDFSSAINLETAGVPLFSDSTKLCFLLIKNMGKSNLTSYRLHYAISWGTGSEENRQSLIDSLITYSYDRASNGMATATIQLHANTKALLTEEEIAQITNKGFTIS